MLKKKEIKNLDNDLLIAKFINLQNDFSTLYPEAVINFNFDKNFYKKDDLSHIKKIKTFIDITEDFLVVIQELRSRNYSVSDITDMEFAKFDSGILFKSFLGKVDVD